MRAANLIRIELLIVWCKINISLLFHFEVAQVEQNWEMEGHLTNCGYRALKYVEVVETIPFNLLTYLLKTWCTQNGSKRNYFYWMGRRPPVLQIEVQ